MGTFHVSGLAVLAWLLSCPGADAAPAAPITDVLLYPGGATITRTVQVRPGVTRAVIDGLPAAFDMQSLHAEASSGVRVGEIVSADVAGTHPMNPEEARLDAQITALQDRQDALDAQAKSSQMALDYLTRLMSVGVAPDDRRDRPPRMMDPRTLTGLAEAMHAAAAKSLAQMQALAVQKREIGRRMDALQRDLERLRSAGTDTRTLTVNFAAQRAGTLLISYEVSNAGWRPAYRASLNSETSIVELERDAIISQQTGEDWHDVRLTLSTSQPRQATRGQEPQPWLLSYVAQIYEEAFRGAPVAMEAAPMSYAVIANQGMIADKALSKPAAAPYAPPTVETQGVFANTYEVPARTSLASDGREVAVELTRHDLAVKQYFQVTPRAEPAVYATAEADMPQGDWPQGAIQLFRNGSYVGRGTWDPQDTDKLVLGFGRDDNIRVSVQPLKADSSSSGILSKRRHREIATLFSFVNRHQRPVTLRVLEASPVSTSDEVEVKTDFVPRPSHENWEDKRGVMEWTVEIAHRGTAKIKTAYDIAYPETGQLADQR